MKDLLYFSNQFFKYGFTEEIIKELKKSENKDFLYGFWEGEHKKQVIQLDLKTNKKLYINS